MAKRGWKKFKSEEHRARVKKKKKAARQKKYKMSKKGKAASKAAKKKQNKKLKEFRKRRAAWWKKNSWPGAPPPPSPDNQPALRHRSWAGGVAGHPARQRCSTAFGDLHLHFKCISILEASPPIALFLIRGEGVSL